MFDFGFHFCIEKKVSKRPKKSKSQKASEKQKAYWKDVKAYAKDFEVTISRARREIRDTPKYLKRKHEREGYTVWQWTDIHRKAKEMDPQNPKKAMEQLWKDGIRGVSDGQWQNRYT